MVARRRSRWLLLTAVVGLIAVPPIAYWQLDHWREMRAARHAYAALSSCLFGGDPAEVAEPDKRLRGSVIAAALDSPRGIWPYRCALYAQRLEQSARALRGQRLRTLASDGSSQPCEADPSCRRWSAFLAELATVRTFLRTARLGALEPARLGRAAAELDLADRTASDAPPAPEPARLFDPRQMTPLFRGNYLRLLTDPGGSDLLQLLFYEDRARYGLCALDLRQTAAARCRPLPAAVPVEYAGELLAAAPGASSLLYAQGFVEGAWTEGLYDPSNGQQVVPVAQRPAGGMSWSDGSFVWLQTRPAEGAIELFRRSADGREQSAQGPLSEGVSAGPRLIWNQIVWTVHLGEGRHRLYAQPVQPAGELFGPIVELGTTAALRGKPEFDMCRTTDAMALMVTGQRRDASLRGLVAFRVAGQWHPALDLQLGSGRYGFTCQGRTATLSWIGGVDERLDTTQATDAEAEAGSVPTPVRGRYDVNRLRCTSHGCQNRHTTVKLVRHSRDSRYVAGDLGDAMVLLWRSDLGDVRMRLAPLEQLPTAPEVPLFDDLAHDGFGWDLERDPIFGRAGTVVVLVSAQVGEREESWTYALRIDSSGSVEPVSVVPR